MSLPHELSEMSNEHPLQSNYEFFNGDDICSESEILSVASYSIKYGDNRRSRKYEMPSIVADGHMEGYHIQKRECAFKAASKGNVEQLKRCLNGMNAPLIRNLFDGDGNSLWHISAANNHLHCIEWLCSLPNGHEALLVANKYRINAVIAAVKNGCLETVQWLIANTCAKTLISHEAKYHLLLHSAAKFGQAQIVRWLCEYINSNDYDINQKDRRGWAPLHYAARWNRITCIKILVFNGADVSICSNLGMRPFDVARMRGHTDCAEYLIAIESCIALANENCSLVPHLMHYRNENAELKSQFNELLHVSKVLLKKSQELLDTREESSFTKLELLMTKADATIRSIEAQWRRFKLNNSSTKIIQINPIEVVRCQFSQLTSKANKLLKCKLLANTGSDPFRCYDDTSTQTTMSDSQSLNKGYFEPNYGSAPSHYSSINNYNTVGKLVPEFVPHSRNGNNVKCSAIEKRIISKKFHTDKSGSTLPRKIKLTSDESLHENKTEIPDHLKSSSINSKRKNFAKNFKLLKYKEIQKGKSFSDIEESDNDILYEEQYDDIHGSINDFIGSASKCSDKNEISMASDVEYESLYNKSSLMDMQNQVNNFDIYAQIQSKSLEETDENRIFNIENNVKVCDKRSYSSEVIVSDNLTDSCIGDQSLEGISVLSDSCVDSSDTPKKKGFLSKISLKSPWIISKNKNRAAQPINKKFEEITHEEFREVYAKIGNKTSPHQSEDNTHMSSHSHICESIEISPTKKEIPDGTSSDTTSTNKYKRLPPCPTIRRGPPPAPPAPLQRTRILKNIENARNSNDSSAINNYLTPKVSNASEDLKVEDNTIDNSIRLNSLKPAPRDERNKRFANSSANDNSYADINHLLRKSTAESNDILASDSSGTGRQSPGRNSPAPSEVSKTESALSPPSDLSKSGSTRQLNHLGKIDESKINGNKDNESKEIAELSNKEVNRSAEAKVVYGQSVEVKTAAIVGLINASGKSPIENSNPLINPAKDPMMQKSHDKNEKIKLSPNKSGNTTIGIARIKHKESVSVASLKRRRRASHKAWYDVSDEDEGLTPDRYKSENDCNSSEEESQPLEGMI